MPRLPRLHVAGGHYHVILRGNHREALFGSEKDRCRLNAIVADALGEQGARLHAYCWMTNHLHLLIQIGIEPLGKLMHQIARRYARYRHRQLRTTGHLFERRYKAWLIDADTYFITLLRYIHLNPVKARMVQHVDDYAWSSHPVYRGAASAEWVTTDFGLSLFGTTVDSAQANYREFMSQPLCESEERVLEDNAHPQDRRVLGADRFVATLPPRIYKPRSPMTLTQLADQICEDHAVPMDLVRSSSRQRMLTPIRVAIAAQAVDQRVATLREVAAFLGRDPASLSELLARHRIHRIS